MNHVAHPAELAEALHIHAWHEKNKRAVVEKEVCGRPSRRKSARPASGRTRGDRTRGAKAAFKPMAMSQFKSAG